MNFHKKILPLCEFKLLLAVAAGLALAWLIEPSLPALDWVWRLLLASACLVCAAAMFRFDASRQQRRETEVRKYLETLCAMDHHSLAEADLDATLNPLCANNPWLSVVARVRASLVENGLRADEAERQGTNAEVRLRRLAAQSEFLQLAIETMTEPLLATNQFDELVCANRRARELFGLTIDPDAVRPVSEQLRQAALVEMLIDARKRRLPKARSSELSVADVQGEQRWFRVNYQALQTTVGTGPDEPLGVLLVMNDISQERGIQKRHAEFVSAASHEMKTPLAGIRAYVELLQDGEAEDEATRDEFLSVIDVQAERLQRLIENLLNIARIEAGVVNVDKQNHSLNELLERAHSVVQPAAEQKQITLLTELSSMYLGVFGDRDMLMQAAINLLSNAIKYTEPGGCVTLRSRLEDQHALIEVEDTGVGLTEEDCVKVFEKFYRVKKDQKMAPGTGLGLPLAKHIVEDVHGGRLTVASELGQGSTFRISLAIQTRGRNPNAQTTHHHEVALAGAGA